MQSLIYWNILFLFLYTLITSVGYYIIGAQFNFEIYEWVWPAALSIQCVWFFAKERSYLIRKINLASYLSKNIDFLIVFVTLLFIRFLSIDLISVWLDEDYQAFNVLKQWPMLASANQHQPPIDMLFTKFGLTLFGENIFGLRIHAIIFSSLAGSCFYLLVKEFSKSIIAAITLTAFFSMHVLVFQYGYEARPISLGLYAEILFFSYLLLIFSKSTKCDFSEKPWLTSLLTFLYLSTLGLQPVFIVAGTALFILMLCLSDKKYIKTLVGIVCGTLIYLPIQYVILVKSPPRFTKVAGFSLKSFFNEFHINNFNILTTYLVPWGVVVFILILFYTLASFYKKKILIKDVEIYYFFFLLLFTIFTLIPFFRSHVSWSLNIYYLISILPIIIILFSGLWSQFIISLRKTRLASFALLTIICSFYFDWADYTKLNFRDDVKTAYSIIKHSSTDEMRVLSLCLNTKNYCPQHLVSQKFYDYFYTNNLMKVKPEITADTIEEYRKMLDKKIPFNTLYFLFSQRWSDRQINPYLDLGNSEILGLQIFKIKISDNNLAQSVISFIKPLVDEGLLHKQLYAEALAYLVVSYSDLGLESERIKYLEIYKNFPDKLSIGYLDDALKKQRL